MWVCLFLFFFELVPFLEAKRKAPILGPFRLSKWDSDP